MKIVSLFLSITVMGVLLVGLIEAEDNETLTFSIERIVSEGLADEIVSMLESLEGVISVQVDTEKEFAFITFEKEKTSALELEEKVNEIIAEGKQSRASEELKKAIEENPDLSNLPPCCRF